MSDIEEQNGAVMGLGFVIEYDENLWKRYENVNPEGCEFTKKRWIKKAEQRGCELVLLRLIPDPIFPEHGNTAPYIHWRQDVVPTDPRNIREKDIWRRLKRLETYGFDVRKLETPGKAGAMDAMILRPRVFPGAPVFVELKKPNSAPRPLQEAVRNDWLARGLDVREYCDTLEKVDALVLSLVNEIADA